MHGLYSTYGQLYSESRPDHFAILLETSIVVNCSFMAFSVGSSIILLLSAFSPFILLCLTLPLHYTWATADFFPFLRYAHPNSVFKPAHYFAVLSPALQTTGIITFLQLSDQISAFQRAFSDQPFIVSSQHYHYSLSHHLNYFLRSFISTCNVMDSMDWSTQPPLYLPSRLPSYTTETSKLTSTFPRLLYNRMLHETK